jgi:hypothetical protein
VPTFELYTNAYLFVDNWLDLNAVLKDYELGKNFRDFVVCKADGKMFTAGLDLK